MKKLFGAAALAVVFALALAFSACSNSSGSASVPFVTNQGTTPDNQATNNPSSGPAAKQAGQISWELGEVEKIAGDAAFANKLTNTGDGAVAYSSSQTSVATIDESGQVTIVAAGSATITATVSDSDTYAYATKTASFALTVFPAEIAEPLTIELPDNVPSAHITVANAWTSFYYIFSTSPQTERPYTASITLTPGVKLFLYARGSENQIKSPASETADGCMNISCDEDFYVYGNAMSLLDADNFKSLKKVPVRKAFAYLFNASAKLKSHPTKDLVLPAKEVITECYEGMFKGCSSLERAPDLPATNSANRCYNEMFMNCQALSQAPKILPSQNAEQGCCKSMFSGCSSLASAPDLPATNLWASCYKSMFENCVKLTKAPAVLPATKMNLNCYDSMFLGCKLLETAPELPAKEFDQFGRYCYQSMFQGCEALTKAPDLPATKLVYGCYSQMFYGCKALESAPDLPATELDIYCYQFMFKGCESLKKAPQKLPAEKLKYRCYLEMFKGCKALEKTPEIPATELVDECCSSMFEGCESLAESPVLKAATLATGCYYKMFAGCKKLVKVTCLATNITAEHCVEDWLSNVAAEGLFCREKTMTGWTINSASGIPSGWHDYYIDN